AFARAGRSGQRVSVALLDLDSFKAINDGYGHAMGDLVLRRTAAVLRRSMRDPDVVGRWGGEEVVALVGTGSGEAAAIVERALAALRAESVAAEDGRVVRVTFSAGVAEARRGVTLEQAVAEADRRLYRAKAAGKDRVWNEPA